MALTDQLRHLRDDVLPRERLRRAFPRASIGHGVRFAGPVDRVSLGDGVVIVGPTSVIVLDGGGLTGARLSVGPGTYIGEFNNLRCAGAPITIGANCLISQHISLVGSNHGTALGEPIAHQEWIGDGIVIGDDVWIGANATIVAGARIGDGVVVGANSVVRGEIPTQAIVAGVPARIIGSRAPR